MSDDDTDYAQLFVFVLYWLLMKLCSFVNFIEQHLVPYEYASISLVIICRSFYVVIIEGDLIVSQGLTSYATITVF